jgi:hypothetical protein
MQFHHHRVTQIQFILMDQLGEKFHKKISSNSNSSSNIIVHFNAAAQIESSEILLRRSDKEIARVT